MASIPDDSGDDGPAPVDWAMIRLKFVTGCMSTKELAAAEGVGMGTLRVRASREGWADARNQMQKGVNETVINDTRESRVREMLDWNREDLDGARMLRFQAVAHIRAATEAGRVLGPFDLRTLAATLDCAQRIGRLALGMSTTNAEISGPAGGELLPAMSLGEFYAATAKLRPPVTDDAGQ